MKLLIELTRRCRFRCLHCSVNAVPNTPLNEIGTSDVLKIISDFHALGGQVVVFSGGEALERPDVLKRAIFYAKRLGLSTVLYTSGYPVDDEIAFELQQIGLDEAYLSLEGTLYTHDLLAGVNGAYALAIKALQNLQNHSIRVTIHFTPTKINFLDIEHVADIAEKHRAACLKILEFVPQGRGYLNREKLELSATERELLKAIVGRIMSRGHVYVDFGGQPIPGFEQQFPCSRGKKLVVTSTGEVIPCSSLRSDGTTPLPIPEAVVGNIRSDSMVYSWIQIQNRARQGCGGNCRSRRHDLQSAQLLSTTPFAIEIAA